ncbi:uncharacterized protein LOC143238993 [Tachypleus tridentatus]|uniref:uncharacterized protein LOC143238993 n=1 Tax=Tachypleus tridentatus TaxID=6853 RepID=UPI003FD0996D
MYREKCFKIFLFLLSYSLCLLNVSETYRHSDALKFSSNGKKLMEGKEKRFLSSSYETFYVEDVCSVSNRSLIDVGSLSYGILKLSKHFPGLHCNITMLTAANNRVFITFLNFFLRERSTNFKSFTKCLDSVKVLDGKSAHEICGKLQYSKSDQLVYSSSPGKNTITLEFHVSDKEMESDETPEVTLVYTCFQISKNGLCNELDSYMCRNGACVSHDLLNDGYNNCGDLSDEKCLQDNGGTQQGKDFPMT